MLKVGVIGLGDIAQKAYLPVLSENPGIDLHLLARKPDRLADIGDRYRISKRFTELTDLLHAGIDAAFVHSSTESHCGIVRQLLEAGIPVYVDKPIDYDYRNAEELANLSLHKRVSLMVGFNRRYAPAYRSLLDIPRDLVVMQKNRVGLPDSARKVVFDDFIHVVDTLRFLSPANTCSANVQFKQQAGLLHHVVLQLSADGFTAIGIMNRMSGANEESLEVMGGGVKRKVTNLDEITAYAASENKSRAGDWTPVGVRRGFTHICADFLTAVEHGKYLSPEDALATHALCEQVVQAIELGK